MKYKVTQIKWQHFDELIPNLSVTLENVNGLTLTIQRFLTQRIKSNSILPIKTHLKQKDSKRQNRKE